MSRAKRGRGRSLLLCVLLSLCLLGAAVLGLLAYRDIRPAAEANSVYEELRRRFQIKDTTGQVQGPDWEAIWKEYPDVVGWIWAPEIGIDYPVLQGETNDTYLYSLPDGSYSIAGSIFLDSRNDPQMTDPLSAMYGHNMTRGNMFTPLLGYRKQAFYLEHPTLLYYCPGKAYQITVFAGSETVGVDGSFLWEYAQADEKGRQEWLDQLIARSEIEGVVKPTPEDRLAALVTCSKADPNVPKFIVYGILQPLYEEKSGPDLFTTRKD